MGVAVCIFVWSRPLAERGGLTYMSIDDWVRQRCDDNRLYEIRPLFVGDRFDRRMWVAPEIWRLINGPWSRSGEEVRCSKLRANLESFVMGEAITVCTRPYEADEAFLGFLDSPSQSVWDIRSREPNPGIRLLGHFIGRNQFVALIAASRSKVIPYIPRGPLGDRDSEEWRRAISDCEGEFRRLFSPFEPLKGDQIHDLLGEPYHSE